MEEIVIKRKYIDQHKIFGPYYNYVGLKYFYSHSVIGMMFLSGIKDYLKYRLNSELWIKGFYYLPQNNELIPLRPRNILVYYICG